MSMLSSFLQGIGIPKGLQSAGLTAMGTAVGGPIGGLIATATSIAGAASRGPSPFSGVVPPGGSPFINQTFGLTAMGGGGRVAPGPNGACPRGYHLNKHDLPGGKQVGPAGKLSVCVRNRHMHALNSSAATRALRRLKRANKMTSKIHRLFHRPARLKPSFGRKK